jgi:DNA-binding HxlR family transcriptional regulator
MSNRDYGQFCGLVRAVEIVGERWGLLIVRDLILGPKRFTDLHRGLPRIPTNVLSARLKGLEEAGVVQRVVQPRPGSGVAYELTEYGRDLEDILLRLGLWGARSLGEPGPEDIVTPDTMTLALRATFRPEEARGLRAGYELHVGPVAVHARVDNGKLDAQPGPLPDPDLVIECGPAIRALLAGELTLEQATASGDVILTGKKDLFPYFLRAFQIPPKS